MRILSLGFPMPGPPVDNHSFAGAPAFFDYDALVVDPKALSQLIEEIADGGEQHATRAGDRIVNGPSVPGAVGLAALLRDRHNETARLLARGGVVVCFAYPNVAHERVAGFPDCDRYCWLPPAGGVRYAEPFLRRGDGAQVRPEPESHPFSPFLARFQGRLAYQAYFDEAASLPTQVLARSAGGAAVAIEIATGEGRIVFLPPPARPPGTDERYELSSALQEAIRQMLRLASASAAPYWLHEYLLPGLGGRIAARAETEVQLIEAQKALETSTKALDELERYRRLLWQEGRYGLEDGVRAALALLGFQVYPASLHQPAQISHMDERPVARVALLEVDASEGAAGMDGHYRLRQRLEEAIAQGKPARGLLIVNGYRRTPPAERPQQYDDALRVAAERLRYCLATSEQLYHAVRAALEGDDATVSAFRERLLTAEGVLQQD
jgi:hypothetical protein